MKPKALIFAFVFGVSVGIGVGWIGFRDMGESEAGEDTTSARGDDRDVAASVSALRTARVGVLDSDLEDYVGKDFGPAGPSLAEFKLVMSRLPTLQRKLAFANMLAQLRPEGAKELHQFLVDSEGGARYDFGAERGLFWERWGELDGPAAAAQIFIHDQRFHQTPTSKTVIKAWAKLDPRAAYAWIKEQEDIPLKRGMMRGVLEGYAEVDPDGAYAFLRDEFDDPSLRAHGYWRIAAAKLADRGLDGVLKFYERFEPDDPDFTNFSRTVADLHSRFPLKEGLGWLGTLEGPMQAKMGNHFMSRYLSKNPDGVVIGLARNDSPPGINRAPYLESAVKKWVKTNPDAMGKWLGENSHAPNYDEVVVPFVKVIKGIDPDSAAAWADTITDPDRKAEAMLALQQRP